jgi:hypothetical protein
LRYFRLRVNEEFRPLIGSAKSIEELEIVTRQLEEKVKKTLGDIEFEGELVDPASAAPADVPAVAAGEEGDTDENASSSSSQYYRTIPYWRCQPYVRPLPTEQIAAIWAAKDNRHRVGFLQQQTTKK